MRFFRKTQIPATNSNSIHIMKCGRIFSSRKESVESKLPLATLIFEWHLTSSTLSPAIDNITTRMVMNIKNLDKYLFPGQVRQRVRASDEGEYRKGNNTGQAHRLLSDYHIRSESWNILKTIGVGTMVHGNKLTCNPLVWTLSPAAWQPAWQPPPPPQDYRSCRLTSQCWCRL